MRDEVTEVARQDHPGDGGEQAAIDVGHAVGAEQRHASGFPEPSRPRQLLQHLRQQLLHLVEVIGGMLVEDHEIRAQPFHPPILLRVQQLPHQRQRFGIQHAHQHDRQIAGDTEAPQVRLTEDVRGKIGRTDERVVRAEHA